MDWLHVWMPCLVVVTLMFSEASAHCNRDSITRGIKLFWSPERNYKMMQCSVVSLWLFTHLCSLFGEIRAEPEMYRGFLGVHGACSSFTTSILLFLSSACNGNWNKPDCRLTWLKSWRNGISSNQDASTTCQLITALQTYLRANTLLHISPSCRLQQPTCRNEKGTSNTAGLPTCCRGRQNAGWISGEMNVKVRIYGDDVIMEKKGQWRSLKMWRE